MQFGHGDASGTCADEQLRDAFLRTPIRILQVGSLLDRSAHHLEILYAADVGFDTRFEKVERSRPVRVGCYGLAFGVGYQRHVRNEGNDVS